MRYNASVSEAGLDIENHAMLAEYLRRRDPSCEPTHFQTLAGGVSNRTVLVEFKDGQSWVIKQALAKLRTKADWFSDPSRVHREALGIRWLSKLAPPGTIPEFVFEDFENHLLTMQAVPQPHENWKTMLMAVPFRLHLDYFRQFGWLLGIIHRASKDLAMELSGAFADRTFFESLRIEPYYEYTAQQIPEVREFILEVVRDTRATASALVHGDFSPKNILIHRGNVVLLDHEVIHWGDPAFDLGFALAHLISKARNLRPKGRLLHGALEFWNAYKEANDSWSESSALAEQRIARHLFACMLARVAGRSPLEYLNDDQRSAQRSAVLRAMQDPIKDVHQLILKLATDVND
jgi:5-methylthioribose kinase